MTVSSEDSSSTGKLVIEGSAVPISNETNSESNFLQLQSSSPFTATFSLTQTRNDYELMIIPDSSITFAQLQNFLLGTADGVSTYETGFFPNETIFTAVDINQLTINSPEINITTFPHPTYYLTGTVSSSSDSYNGSVSFLTANLGGYQSSFLYLDLSKGKLELLAQNLLQADSTLDDVKK